MAKELKQKLKMCIDYQYRIKKDETLYTILDNQGFEELEGCFSYATKDELFDLLKVYHMEVTKLRKEIKELIEE